jgi:hypothetical protein
MLPLLLFFVVCLILFHNPVDGYSKAFGLFEFLADGDLKCHDMTISAMIAKNQNFELQGIIYVEEILYFVSLELALDILYKL